MGRKKKGREGRKANEENVPRTHTHSKRARQAKKGGLGKKLTDPSPLRSSATTEKPTRSATPQEPMHVEREKEGGENKRGWETVCHHPASATHRESTAMGKTHIKCLRLLRCTATLRVSVCVCVCVCVCLLNTEKDELRCTLTMEWDDKEKVETATTATAKGAGRETKQQQHRTTKSQIRAPPVQFPAQRRIPSSGIHPRGRSWGCTPSTKDERHR